MTEPALNYFTHVVDGAVYGAWYRVNSPTQLEVIGVGMLESSEYAGFSPEHTAKSMLENFVRWRSRSGAPIPSLETLNESHSDAPRVHEIPSSENAAPVRRS